jgi:MoxR-like ATPase
MNDWKLFTNAKTPTDAIARLPDPPDWRNFRGEVTAERDFNAPPSPELTERGAKFQATPEMIEMVNAALYLRRPLLITGDPGTGKSSLIYAVAHELQLGEVLKWPITSRSTLAQGLYQYDAIGRLQESQLRQAEAVAAGRSYTAPSIGDFVKLGPLGTALLPTARPRALLIDEIDKSDLDLPNDLLHVFEEGEFEIPELKREKQQPIEIEDALRRKVTIAGGLVKCRQFPFVILTSNGEREFPAPFKRRCLQLEMPKTTKELLADIVRARLGPEAAAKAAEDGGLIAEFLKRKQTGRVAIDQLLGALFILKNEFGVPKEEGNSLADRILKKLD